MFKSILLALAVLAPGPAPTQQAQATTAGFDHLKGFASVLVTHLNAVLGTENLPTAMGQPVQPGMFVTVSMERVQLYDRNISVLNGGSLGKAAAAAECKSGCAEVLFTSFQEGWLEAAVEAKSLSVEIPTRVLFAAHRNLPARTLVNVAYAVAETRPVGPPQMALVLNGGKAGLRSLPFHLVPPEGLVMPRESAALGLTVTVGAAGFRVTAASPRFGRELTAASVPQLVALVKDIQKRYASKTTIVYQFDDTATVGRLLQVVQAVREQFPTVVLSAGQKLLVR